jgi:hypothetical protein
VTVAGPDLSVWWDVDAVADAALEILRLTAGDVDAARIRDLVPVAGQRVNRFVDRAGPLEAADAPADLERALVDVVVALYRDKDTPPASPDLAFGLGYRAADPLSQERGALVPHKERFPIG